MLGTCGVARPLQQSQQRGLNVSEANVLDADLNRLPLRVSRLATRSAVVISSAPAVPAAWRRAKCLILP